MKEYEITKKERIVWELLSERLLYKEIAAKAPMSINTVKKHLKSLYKKIGAKNRVEAEGKFFKLKNSRI